MGFPADRASSVVPPTEQNATELALTSGTASAATAMNGGEGGRWFSWICTATHNIRLSGDGSSTITNPSTSYFFAANTVYSVELNKQNTYFKIKASADGSVLYWLSSRS